jgi:hypothetical protein
MDKINPKEAPKGYYAAPVKDAIDPCGGCAFYRNTRLCGDNPCMQHERNDHQLVIFRKLKKRSK